DPVLLLWADAAEQIDLRQLPDQRLVRYMRQRLAGKNARDRYADLRENMAAYQFVVAGHHLYGHARRRHRLDRRAGAGFRRIEEDGEAREDELGLVAGRGGCVA